MTKKRKDKNRHSIWKRMHFKYRLSILNENTLEEVWKLRVSMFNGIMLYATSLFLLMVVSSVIIISTPLRNYLPGYLDSEIREQAIKTAMRADSLEQQQLYQNAYLQNIKDIFEGKVQPESQSKVDTVMIAEDDKSLQSTSRERKYRQEYEEAEKYNLSSISTNDMTPTEGVTFFRPIRGVITSRFNPSLRQYGLQIAAAGENIVATLEGSVVFAGYDPDAGYMLQIQHKNGFVSVYKGASMLLKKTGDKARTGEAIAIISSSDKEKADDKTDKNKEKDKNKKEKESATKRILQFELWYKGSPVNPELYISF
ncbi:murein hydrolase activator EnvC family protein [Dysgonomonas macrotermitis]|uniref:Peptidase family M23 n=1 Tax=Dysgonomonas macrotermitis TaxID=1346286 RepID=A0A1M4ZXL7_9BACT|nr:M23 family metallopeptidase [Dysgonomonas macrotermitis]SHF22386.1 Peptidase family M23 [Dysgonomonas macrotermitis]